MLKSEVNVEDPDLRPRSSFNLLDEESGSLSGPVADTLRREPTGGPVSGGIFGLGYFQSAGPADAAISRGTCKNNQTK